MSGATWARQVAGNRAGSEGLVERVTLSKDPKEGLAKPVGIAGGTCHAEEGAAAKCLGGNHQPCSQSTRGDPRGQGAGTPPRASKDIGALGLLL